MKWHVIRDLLAAARPALGRIAVPVLVAVLVAAGLLPVEVLEAVQVRAAELFAL